MNLKDKKGLYDYLKRYYGDKQLIVAIEELSELQKEITKSLRGKLSKGHLMEEIADVKIMVEQLTNYYDIKDLDIQRIIDEKLERTKNRLNKNNL